VQSDLASLQAALKSGEGVMLSTSTAHSSNPSIISDHMYSVTAVDASAGTVTIFNPWGHGYDSADTSATVTMTVAQLQQQGVYLYEATGKAATS